MSRIEEARVLLNSRQYAGSVYLAGRGVEGMLRALIWKRDLEIRLGRKALETGHDLRQLLQLVANLGLLAATGDDVQFRLAVHRVARLWFNDMRFISASTIEKHWRRMGFVGRRRSFGLAANELFDDCLMIVKRGERLCR